MEIKRGNTSFNVEQFKDWTRTEFMIQFSGLVRGCNLSDVWDEISKLNGNTESDKGLGKKTGKGSKSKRNNEAPIQPSEFQETDN